MQALNDYLQRYARQNDGKGAAKTFVAVPSAGSRELLGYYSISPGAVDFDWVPTGVLRGLGQYDVPVFRLSRLAVRRDLQGRGLGGELVLAAGARAIAVSAEVGGLALAIDAKDDRAASWYAHLGATRLIDNPLKLILPLAVVAEALRRTLR